MDRIRASIGELMTDEDLKKIIERGVETALFTEKASGSGWDRKVEPSFVEKAVRELLSQRMTAAVDAWVSANPDRLQAAVNDAIKTGVTGCVMQVMDARFYGMFASMQEQMRSQGLLPR